MKFLYYLSFCSLSIYTPTIIGTLGNYGEIIMKSFHPLVTILLNWSASLNTY
jgi:hypothetical protein